MIPLTQITSAASQVAPAKQAQAARPTSPAPRRAGFSLIEMMAVISVAAILLAITYPLFNAVERGNRVGAGINTVNAAIASTRAYSGRTKPDQELQTGVYGNFSGTALLFTPSRELRFVENTQYAKNGSNQWLEANGQNGYADVPDRSYINLPQGTGFVGVKRNSAGDAVYIAPPFAVRFDENGKLIAGANISSPDGRVVIYDGNHDGQYTIGSARGASYNPADWDGEADPTNRWDKAAGKYRLPFEVIEAVPAIIIFNQFELEDSGLNLVASGTAPYDINAAAKAFIQTNGKVIYFSRYTGNVIREGKVQ